ncbi:MAG: ATP-binding protein [Pleomorphochaeta sp.]
MFEREKFNLEFKEIINKSFLKTVSAFSNYNDGKIIFGIKDNSEIIGIDISDENCLKIENMINSTISPVPFYKIEIKTINDKNIIILNILKGKYTPYYYHGKAYNRSNTSTIEIDRLQLNRLILEGSNLNYENMKSQKQDLEFNFLEKELINILGIEKISLDILKTLNLYDKNGFYNIAGALLADNNDINNSGIDIVKFGENINQILFRKTLNKISLLDQYNKTLEIFETYFQFEEIEGFKRVKKELIPREAFREAIANALVHSVWDTNSYIKISIYDNRVEILSPGGLPNGISKDEYLKGNISILRNPILAGVFYRLNIIEKFGTGISRIIEEYRNNITKPNFEIYENSINIILPLIELEPTNLTTDELLVYKILNKNGELSRNELEKFTGYNKSKMVRIINKLVNRNIVRKLGRGPNTTYNLI